MDIALLYRARLVQPCASAAAGRALSGHLLALGAERLAARVTGFLLVADGWVYEVLEGDFTAVSRAFGEVLVDAHLREVEMLSNAAISSRACAQWSHGVLGEDEALPADLAAKLTLLHNVATRFGASQPMLRDFLARLGQDVAAPRVPLMPVRAARYAHAG